MATDTHQKLNGLDHLRALAITFVFFFHYFILSGGQPAWLPDVASFGWTGVDLFFVLSGFLIASPLLTQLKQQQPIAFRAFFLKRFFRIIPAYWVTVALYFCLPFFREKEALPPLWKFITFTQNLNLNLQHFGTFSHAWSLCVEEHFYLFFPCILFTLQYFNAFKKAYWLLLVFFLFGFAIRLYSYQVMYGPKATAENNWMYWYQYLYYPTYNRLDGLLVGVAIAALPPFLPKAWARISQFGNVSIGLGGIAIVGAYFLCEDQQTFAASIFGFPLVALGYGFVVVGAISSNSFLYRYPSKITSSLATLSYALYLTHKGIIHITQQLLVDFHLDPHLMLLLCMGTCLLGAYSLHLVIEKPFMKLRNRLLASQ